MTLPVVLAQGTALWLLFLILAILNGLFRDQGYSRRMSELRAHQLSTVLLSVAFLVVIWGFLAWRPVPLETGALWLLGVWWAVLTLLFEFVFFHYIGGKSWNALLADYNIFKGRIFPLVLLTLLLGPVIIGTLLQRT